MPVSAPDSELVEGTDVDRYVQMVFDPHALPKASDVDGAKALPMYLRALRKPGADLPVGGIVFYDGVVVNLEAQDAIKAEVINALPALPGERAREAVG